MAAVHIAGHPALDFIGTLSERGSKDVEELRQPQDLMQWFIDADVVDRPEQATEHDLAAARTLRASLFRALESWKRGEGVPDEHRLALNTASTSGQPRITMQPDQSIVREGTAQQCLGAIAASFLQLIASTDPSQVRWCADRTCTHPFIDRSRAQRRRWCEMKSCGTRNKQRELRARKTD
ncbi:putative RNA-binding Zn ribbon-like protein [Naumannella cuiyingiana]|uniref:Putative RNA-binding Zn ribbon-like protein n=1 Tax=Naumannella cuiyingiana TaxID=1347891 RepID=A0A7Z0DB92_9ACTN|nr:ABATE domain-containing protein [Naumannella cuiyingiana]NYI72151.1 putative RNA-binding Zn ribbon-like protein [Naumannella cuiyingiana]